MEVKWICKKCNSVNHGEKSEDMKCFVCGETRSTEPLMVYGSVSKKEALHETLHESLHKKEKLLDRIKRRFSLLGTHEGETSSSKRKKIVDWETSVSPAESKEAYVLASPIYETEEEPVSEPETEHRTDPRPAEREHETVVSEEAYCTPRPEDRIRFNLDKIRTMGCVRIQREEMHGVKGYSLIFKSAPPKFMTVTNMKLLGLAKEE